MIKGGIHALDRQALHSDTATTTLVTVTYKRLHSNVSIDFFSDKY